MMRSSRLFYFALFLLVNTAWVLYLVRAIIGATREEGIEAFEVVRKLMPAGTCLCEYNANFHCGDVLSVLASEDEEKARKDDGGQWRWDFERDAMDVGLERGQCDVAFPGLFEDVKRAVRQNGDKDIQKEDLDDVVFERGMVRAMIFDRKIYVMRAELDDSDHRKKAIAIMQSMNRAITAIPISRPVPNIEFVFTVEDMPSNASQPLWALARRAQDVKSWLMPDFAFWSWDIPDLGAWDEVVDRVADAEKQENVAWNETKIPKLFWRGKLPMAPKLRHSLVVASQDKSWSDVEPLIPALVEGAEGANYMGAVDQCEYMFIAHVEGRSYSGSLKYRLLCNSVAIIHKLQWIEHYHFLLVSEGPSQNFVQVERDFSDLDEKVEYYLRNPELAERVARNSKKTFRERYLTPAAEACYWRSLIAGYSKVSFTPELFEGHGKEKRRRGMRFENFVLLDSSRQLLFNYRSLEA